MALYAIFRVQQLRTVDDLHAATRHGRREDNGTHYDVERTQFNWHWAANRVIAPIDWATGVENAISRLGAKCRKGSALAAEIFVGVSPEYFLPETPDGHFDMDRVAEWANLNMTVFYKRFGRAVVGARLDLDEGSPHMSICVVPTYEKVTKHTKTTVVSYRKIFGGESIKEARENMTAWQDWYARQMAPLGLSRGIPKRLTGRSHLSHQQYARKKRREDDERRAALDAAKEIEARMAADAEAARLDTERLQSVARRNAREATRVLLEAEKARDYMSRAVDLLKQHAPDLDVLKAIEASSEMITRWDDDVERISQEIDALLKPSSGSE